MLTASIRDLQPRINNTGWYLFYLLVLFMLFPVDGVAQDNQVQELTITNEDSQFIGQSLVYFSVADDHWTAAELSSQLSSVDWVRSTAEAPNLGLHAEPTWFALSLASSRDVHRLLEISYPVLKEVDVYLFREGVPVTSVFTGAGRAFDSRPIAHRNFIIPLEIKTGQQLLLIRVRTGGALQLPVVLWQPNAFMVADQQDFATIMLFAGIMLAMAIYNLLLYSSVRETSYFWYVLSVVAIAWGQLGIRGLTFQYIWPDFPQLNEIGLTHG